MFEKEAEEWRNSLNYEIDNDTLNNIVIPCIEFGYNKANEWHYVKDGDLPPASGEMHAERYPILACTKNGYVTVAIRRKHGRAYEWFCSDYDGNTLYLDKEIIAWCEIPKYTEE